MIALVAAGHAILYKRDPRSSAIWVILILVLPLAGPLLYLLLGINRVERRAGRLRGRLRRNTNFSSEVRYPARLPPGAPWEGLQRLLDRVAGRPLTGGNTLEVLDGGAAAYPAMLAAIESAERSIGLASYIFDGEGIGREFVAALARARARGVAVRVLIDDFDVRFTRGGAAPALRAAGVTVGVFNPPLLPARWSAIHLRNHRKILVIDGTTGFTGGLNIDARYWRPEDPATASGDLHVRLRGPAVAQLSEVFADDWRFATSENLRGEAWFPSPASFGSTRLRGIAAGPDEWGDRLRWVLQGALHAAQHRVQIVSPYFLPDAPLLAALNAAALRGVEVDVILPAHGDLPHVDWAMRANLWQVLEGGCRVWFQPEPFDHTKLLVVDDTWFLLGSANWDARSLRLNFEFVLEGFDPALGTTLAGVAKERRRRARPVTAEQLAGRSLPAKLRDGVARLFLPFL
jgi:cardiolipin synthase